MSRIQNKATAKKVNIIQQVADEAKARGLEDVRKSESISWYRTFINKNVYRVKVFENSSQMQKSKPTIGKMYIYGYNAKLKDELPYWDAMPVTIFFSEDEKRLFGFNFHYIPIELRIVVLKKLYDIIADDQITENTKLVQSYNFLKGLSTFDIMKPTIHSYLKTHFTTPLIEVPANQWPIALFLPIANWQKANFQTVYANSKKKIRGK